MAEARDALFLWTQRAEAAEARIAELEAALTKIAGLTGGPGLPAQIAPDELFAVAARLNREGYEAYRITQHALKGTDLEN